MLSEAGNNSARYMRITALCFLVHAVLLVGEGGWTMINHSSHVPHYHNRHVHDSCHSLAFVLGILLVFYTIAVLLIVFTKEARSQKWGVRALGLPNLLFIVYMAINLGWLALQYNEHDEHWFVFNIQLACTGGLLYITYFLLSFSTNGLAEFKSYAKVWVLILGLPISSVALIFFYENLAIHKWVGLATLVPYILTLISAQRGRVTKVIKNI